MKERHPIADWSLIIPFSGLVIALLILLYFTLAFERLHLGMD